MADLTSIVPANVQQATGISTQSDSDDNAQDSSPVDTTAPDNTATPAPAPDEVDSESGKRKGYALAAKTGAIKFTDVQPGQMYEGTKVPPNATSTDGKDWYDKTGSVIVDADVDPDGTANEFSSNFIKGWAENAVNNGVNPIAIEKIITPWADLANRTKTFEMQNADNILMKQGLDMDNQTKFTNLSNEVAGNLATMDPVSGAMMVSQIRNNKPAGAPDSPILSRFGVQPTDTPAVAFKKIQASGPGQTAITALQAQRTNIAAANQGIQTSQITNAKDLADAYVNENNNSNSLNQTQQTLGQAKDYISQLIKDGEKGGKVFNSLQDLKNAYGGNSPQWAAAQSAIAILQSQSLRAAIGTGNRMTNADVDTWGKALASGDLPLRTLQQQLGNAQAYLGQQQQISQSKQGAYKGIAQKANITLPEAVQPAQNVPFPTGNPPAAKKSLQPQNTPVGNSIIIRGTKYFKMKDGPDNVQSNWSKAE